jgi:hypothetical protein
MVYHVSAGSVHFYSCGPVQRHSASDLLNSVRITQKSYSGIEADRLSIDQLRPKQFARLTPAAPVNVSLCRALTKHILQHTRHVGNANRSQKGIEEKCQLQSYFARIIASIRP